MLTTLAKYSAVTLIAVTLATNAANAKHYMSHCFNWFSSPEVENADQAFPEQYIQTARYARCTTDPCRSPEKSAEKDAWSDAYG